MHWDSIWATLVVYKSLKKHPELDYDVTIGQQA